MSHDHNPRGDFAVADMVGWIANQQFHGEHKQEAVIGLVKWTEKRGAA